MIQAVLRTICPVLLLALPAISLSAPGAAPVVSGESEELAAARELFERNLQAIRDRDQAAYLDCYWKSEQLIRSGPTGFRLGYTDHAAQTGDAWPDVFEARDLRLTPVESGVVYGSYRYRVSYSGDEHRGISQRLFLKTDDGWRIALTSAFEALPGTPPPPTVLTGATLIDGTGAPPLENAVVVLRDGRIDCAGAAFACPVPDGVERLDLTGSFLTPGLVDAHVHFSQTGWADGRPDSLDLREEHPYEAVQAGLRANPERWFRSYLCSGVTAVFDVGGYPWTWELIERAEGDSLAPHVAAAGPLLSTLDFWLNLPAERQFIHLSDPEAGRATIGYHASHGASAVKVWFIVTPDRDFDEMAEAVQAAGEEARAQGLPLIVHATGLREAKAALRAGASLLVHSVWDLPVDDEFLDLAREAGTYYCPTLTVAGGYHEMYEAIGAGRSPAIDDPNGCVDPETRARLAEAAEIDASRIDATRRKRTAASLGPRERTMSDNLKRVHAAGIPIAMGTDAGNPLTLHGISVYAEMEAMQQAGLTPMEVLVAATRDAATAMGRGGDLGTIEAGKLADLLVVGANPAEDVANMRSLRLVVRGGVVRAVEELRPLPNRSPDR